MAVIGPSLSGHLHTQLTRSLERILDEANQSGELKLSNRKLKEFPKAGAKYNLSDTVIADLSKNRFSELPEEVTNYFFLEKLQCYHNAIRYIPDTISSLQCLNYLDLSRNQLTSLPREICQLPIQILLISNNKLSSLPDEISRMSQLTELDVSNNHLTHLPMRMGDLRNLQSLTLRSNLLLCVPVELTYLNLVKFDLRSNRISILPIELREMTSLIELLVDDNPLTSPPASLCKRGRVHIFKYLENEAIKLDRKAGIIGNGTLARKSKRNGTTSSPGPPSHAERLKNKRQNVDSGYSTSSDCYDKRWSQELIDNEKIWPTKTGELNGANSNLDNYVDDPQVRIKNESNRDERIKVKDEPPVMRVLNSPNSFNDPQPSPPINGNGIEEKNKTLGQIQTYKEYKEALKQQRAQEVSPIYRSKENEEHLHKTEPNTPTHHSSPARTGLASSKSDPTPLNTALSSPQHVFDDTTTKKPVQKVPPSRNLGNNVSFATAYSIINGNDCAKTQNGNTKYIQDYVKPKSPVKTSSGILSHDNVPSVDSKPGSPRLNSLYVNGTSTPKTGKITKLNFGTKDSCDKMSFTMRREIDKAKEETDLINQLRNVIEQRLKMVLPEDLAPALTDGVVLCHLANHIRPRSVASIHVPSPAVPKLTMARCRRNVDNFIEACRKIGVDENLVCTASDVLEGRGLVQVAVTVTELVRFHSPRSSVNQIPTVV